MNITNLHFMINIQKTLNERLWTKRNIQLEEILQALTVGLMHFTQYYMTGTYVYLMVLHQCIN
jgi:hypothetical protein